MFDYMFKNVCSIIICYSDVIQLTTTYVIFIKWYKLHAVIISRRVFLYRRQESEADVNYSWLKGTKWYKNDNLTRSQPAKANNANTFTRNLLAFLFRLLGTSLCHTNIYNILFQITLRLLQWKCEFSIAGIHYTYIILYLETCKI